MSSIHQANSQSQSKNHRRAARPHWRVILVGRTGLDQLLRRHESIELVRARDTIDAMGELSDPIDHDSPAQAVVLVGASSEPHRNELEPFISSLRLIDDGVRVLRVGSRQAASDLYDGWIDPESGLEQIIRAFEDAASDHTPVTLRFVDAVATEASPAPADGQTADQADDRSDDQAGDQAEDKPGPGPDNSVTGETAAQATRAVETEPGDRPRVVVVAKNEDFEHRAQAAFEDESEIHKQVLSGVGVGGGGPAASPIAGAQSVRPGAPSPAPQSRSQSRSQSQILGPHDDGPLVAAMLSGRSVLEAALERIRARLGREDIRFDTDAGVIGAPVVVGNQTLGALASNDESWTSGAGRERLACQARWLSSWIRLEVQQSELRRSAFTDHLTGAWNRRYFTRFLDAAIKQSREARQPLTVMLFDIDEFKHFNDAYGHAAGDEILTETVRLLTSVIRPSDRVCRVGGDEFAVIFYEPSGPRDPSSKPLESVYQLATRFQKQICTHRFPKLGLEALGTLTVSGGLASFPWDGFDAESLLEKADQLAIESKRQGKNAITLGPGAESVCRLQP